MEGTYGGSRAQVLPSCFAAACHDMGRRSCASLRTAHAVPHCAGGADSPLLPPHAPQVGPAPGQRFSPAFLQGVSKFVAWQQGRQQQQQAQQHGRQLPPPAPAPPAPPLPAALAGTAAATAPSSPEALAAVFLGAEGVGEAEAPVGGSLPAPAAAQPPAVPAGLAAAAVAAWDEQQIVQHLQQRAHLPPPPAGSQPPHPGCGSSGDSGVAAGEGAWVGVELVLLGAVESEEAGKSTAEPPPAIPGVQLRLTVHEPLVGAAAAAGGGDEPAGPNLAVAHAGDGQPEGLAQRGWWPANALAEVLPDALPAAQVMEGGAQQPAGPCAGPPGASASRGERAGASSRQPARGDRFVWGTVTRCEPHQGGVLVPTAAVLTT